MSDKPDYLDDPAFREPHAGEVIRSRFGHEVGRDPSVEQIRRRCECIQASWSTGERANRLGRRRADDRAYEVPVVSSTGLCLQRNFCG